MPLNHVNKPTQGNEFIIDLFKNFLGLKNCEIP